MEHNPPTYIKGPCVEDRVGDSYLLFYLQNYRIYPENSVNTEFIVFVEATKERLGNKSPIYFNHIFSAEVKGVMAIQRVNASKIAVIFKQYDRFEKTGIIRFVSAKISNKELYSRLLSVYEMITIRRLSKKVGNEHVPLQTVIITFLSNILPGTSPRIITSKRKIVYRESSWKVHQFQVWSGEQIGCVIVLKMKGSLLLWVGLAENRHLGEVALGMPASGSAREGLSTTLLEGDTPAAAVALRMAAALQQPVFVCCALPLDRFKAPLLERALAALIRSFPEQFNS